MDTCDRLVEDLGEPVERAGAEDGYMEGKEKYREVGKGECGKPGRRRRLLFEIGDGHWIIYARLIKADAGARGNDLQYMVRNEDFHRSRRWSLSKYYRYKDFACVQSAKCTR